MQCWIWCLGFRVLDLKTFQVSKNREICVFTSIVLHSNRYLCVKLFLFILTLSTLRFIYFHLIWKKTYSSRQDRGPGVWENASGKEAPPVRLHEEVDLHLEVEGQPGVAKCAWCSPLLTKVLIGLLDSLFSLIFLLHSVWLPFRGQLTDPACLHVSPPS